MKCSRTMALAIALVMCVALLVGCGTPGAAPAGNAAAPAPGGAAAPAEGEKVFRFIRSWEEASWDPALFGQEDDIQLALVIYEKLTDLDNKGAVIPCLAESWEVDGAKITYHLRKGVQWHFGYGEFTSADVKFSVERHLDEAVGSKNIDNLNLANLASIDTPDPYTVVFNLKQPDADFLTRMSLVYGYMISKAAYEDKGLEGITTRPVGTGPFMYDSGVPMTHTEAVKNPDYWGEKAKVDRMAVTIVTDANVGYTAMENGEIEAIGVYDMDKEKELEAKGFTVTQVPYMELLYVSMNMQDKPFDNPKIREAFFCAIDPQYFVDNMFYGTTKVPGGVVPEQSKYAVSDYFKSTYDPAKAKALLSEAGYNGETVTMWAPNDALSQTPAIIAQSQLQEAGFNVEMQLVDFGVFIEKVRTGEAQIWLLYNTTPALADETVNRYKSEFYPGRNWSGIVDAEYDKLVDAGMSATTEAEKAQFLADAQRRLMDLQVIYPISTHNYAYVTKTNVSGYFPTLDGIINVDNVSID